ncbi:RNA-binding protein [Histoplasma capsulatum H143]|uniref:Probable endonuclease LCL3 n=1 Tax=Ajellomyces capsulatus (strain H143) TaxID=544712 RepID=C6HEQ8_AJECH|nr:RNA-binding protein [Histoplasma capsulatum H143]
MSLLEARVKTVLSGDTLILTHVINRSQERTLSLAYVSAPRLRREDDEPFAFQSREFLRELLVGKVVKFQVLYTVPTTKREYGIVKLHNNQELPELCVAEGWVKVREDAGKREESEDIVATVDKLRELENRARSESKGVWASTGGELEIAYEVPDPKALIESEKGNQIAAVVERVLSGDRLIVRLLVAPHKHIQTLVVVAGIRAPATKRTNPDGTEQPGEPLGEQAQQFVELRLLQRKVKISLLGVTLQNQLVASVLHPNGNIAKFLLEAGLARCADHHSTMIGKDMTTLRQAENAAKEARKGLFMSHNAPKAGAGAAQADYVVTRVFSADTIFVRTKTGKDEKRISLSSVRHPRTSDPKQAPFILEAKEFMRKKLIGKHVKVKIDGKRPASEGYEEREVGTVMSGNTNIALALVQAGYASVIRHRRDDDDRSPEYDDLLRAEEAAQKEGKGMWSSKPPTVRAPQDYSENVQKAKIQASVLQRQRKVPGVVDFVKSGSRFTILLPKDNAKLTLVLSGIRAPRSARNPEETGEPFGQEAHDFAYRRCMQRDVEIDVETIDKVGGFIGSLYINRESFSKILVEEGLATVHAYSAEQGGHAAELFAAEKKAKEARKGLWHDWDPSKDLEEGETVATNGKNGAEAGADAPQQRKKDYRDVMVTNVDENGKLKIQQIGAGTTALTEMMSAFRAFHLNKANDTALSGPPKAGDLVAARFTEDNEWYRARIRRNDREAKKADVVYIDYGNSETVPWTRLRPLTQPQFSVQKIRPQATETVLSFLQLPASPEYLRDAVGYLGERTLDRQLVANVDYTAPDGTLHVTLMDPAESKSLEHSINADVISEGLAMVPRKLKEWERSSIETLAHLEKLQNEAKEGRKGMWEYGDLTEG